MSVTVSQGEGVTVITVATNPKSKWPVLCQILGIMCYSPVFFSSRDLGGKMTDMFSSLGTVQIIVGAINIVVGILFAVMGLYWYIMMFNGPFWLGGVFLAVGILSLLPAKFQNSCLLIFTVILNLVSAALAVTAVVLYSVDLASDHMLSCSIDGYYYSRYDYSPTPSPEQLNNQNICLKYRHFNKVALIGLDVMMIVLSALQFCVALSYSILSLKAICKGGSEKSVEDPQLHEPLLEKPTASPAC